MPGFPTIRTTDYGPETSDRPHAVILAPHASNGEAFLAAFPEISEACRGTQEATLRCFFNIECDRGSSSLAHAIAELVLEEKPQARIHVVEATVPRAIIDANRVPNHALRNIFRRQEHPELAERLEALHAVMIGEIRRQLARMQSPGGVFLDIHTMAPQDRKEEFQIAETPENLAEYVRTYTDPSCLAERRPIDLVTDHENGMPLAWEPLVTRMEQALFRNRLMHTRNIPYATTERHLGTEHMRLYRGLAVDVPKDLLSEQSAVRGDFDLASFVVNKPAVRRIARPLAEALVLEIQG